MLAASCPILVGQTTGTILGHVTDSTGAIIATASVTVQNLETGLTRQTSSNSDGVYIVSLLPPGTYRITVETPSFRSFTQSGIRLEVGQNARVDARLTVGAMTEKIEVVSTPLTVDTQSTTLGATVDHRRLVSLPLSGRNVLSLMKLQAGVGLVNLPNVYTSSRNGPSFNVGGGKGTDHNVMLDGATFVTAKQGSAQNLPSPDALEEFRLLTNTYSAEYGRSAGVVITAVTKSGTNEYHGSAWEFLRNDALNARNSFASSKPFLRQNQFGLSFGGPVRLPRYRGKNRTFFFVSYQGLRIREQGLRTFFPLSEAERQGNFSRSSRIIQDPLNNQPFAGNVIPAPRLDPMARNILGAYVPLPNRPDGSNLDLVSLPTGSNQITIRGDHHLTSSDILTVRYYRNRDAAKRVGGGDIYALAAEGGNRVSSLTVTETHTFSPALLSELRFSYTPILSKALASPANKGPRDLGANYDHDGPIAYTPGISVAGRLNLAHGNAQEEWDNLIQVDNKVLWFKGKHSFKFGGMLLAFRQGFFTHSTVSGGFGFDGTFSRDAAADFLLGRPNSFAQWSAGGNNVRGGDLHFFAQDDYKVLRRLTLNLGVRYELRLPWKEVDDQVSVIRPGQQSTRFPTAPPGMVYPGDAGISRGLLPMDKNNIGPRFGFAWDVFGTGRTAIRGAYGIFFNPEKAFFIDRTWEQPPFKLQLSLSPPASLRDPYAGRSSPFPFVLDLKNPSFAYPIQGFNLSPDLRDGYVQQFNLNVQQQFGQDMSLQVGYVGRVGHAQTGTRETNAAVFGPGATAGNAQQRRPYFPAYYASIATLFSDGNTNYHSLQATFDKRFSRNYTFQVAYTFSKSIDERSAGFGGPAGPPNPIDYRAGERGRSDYDQRHLLRMNAVVDLPRLENRNFFVATVVGGWRLAPIVSYSSGLPFNVLLGRDVALTGGGRGLGGQRPNLLGEAKLDPGRSRQDLIARYFNTGVYSVPSPGQFGTGGRNQINGPGAFETDIAIMKRFYLPRERLGSIELRGEIFNLLNFANLGVPTANAASPAFGRILTAASARVAQLALRYDF